MILTPQVMGYHEMPAQGSEVREIFAGMQANFSDVDFPRFDGSYRID
jgi:hypothetical protein